MSVANEVKYCFHHEKIKFISSSHHVIFFSMQKAVNDVNDIFTSEVMENVTGYFLVKHSHLYNKFIYSKS